MGRGLSSSLQLPNKREYAYYKAVSPHRKKTIKDIASNAVSCRMGTVDKHYRSLKIRLIRVRPATFARALQPRDADRVRLSFAWPSPSVCYPLTAPATPTTT